MPSAADHRDFADALAAAILATRSDAIIAADRAGSITYWNPGATRIFGFAREEALGQSLDIIIPQQLRARHWAGYRRVMETGKSHYGEGQLLSVPALDKSGARLSLEFTIVLLTGPTGTVSGIAAILRDVTPRFEEMRALRRKLKDAQGPTGQG